MFGSERAGRRSGSRGCNEKRLRDRRCQRYTGIAQADRLLLLAEGAFLSGKRGIGGETRQQSCRLRVLLTLAVRLCLTIERQGLNMYG